MRKESFRDEAIFVIHDFLSAQECRAFIELGEQLGFRDAPISTGAGEVMRQDVRNNTRVMCDNSAFAQQLWARAEPWVVPNWFHRRAIGLNERFRFDRYEPGQRFAPHFDGRFERDNGERSEFSFLVYLNEDFTGGHTLFHELPPISIRPTTGAALVFQHHQLHEGAVIEAGRKYVLRTDVMYSALT